MPQDDADLPSLLGDDPGIPSTEARAGSRSRRLGRGRRNGPDLTPERAAELAIAVSEKALNVGVDGTGPWKSSVAVAEEALEHHGDREKAIARLIGAHVRLTSGTGFVSGLGGLLTMPVALPADLTALWLAQARLAGAIAHLRGYDVHSEEVRSVVLISLVGSSATEAVAKAGVQIGTRSTISAIKQVPGRALIEINKRIGFRLITKAGTKGVINLTKLAPIAGGVVGGSVNLLSTRAVGAYAKRNFPATTALDAGEVTVRTSADESAVSRPGKSG